LEDLLEFAVDYGRRLGASYSEARYQRDVNQQTLLKNGVPEISAASVAKGIGIRVLVNGSLGFAGTSTIAKAALRRAVKEAVELARVAARAVKQELSMSEERMVSSKDVVKPRVPFETVTPESRVELLREADMHALEAAKERDVKLPSRLLEVGSWNTEKHILNSDGADIYSSVARATLLYMLTAYHPQRGAVQRFENLGEARGWEAVERWDVPTRVGGETENLCSVLLEAVEPPRGTVDLVLGPEIVGLVCHESAGHPGEADRMLGREAAQAGETYVRREMLGTRIGSEQVTIVDDPSLPHSFGYYLYDEEGVKGRERTLIENGVLVELLHNRETGPRFNVGSNGSARACLFDKEPIVRMANTYMKAGGYSVEELVEDVKDGVYIESYQEWNIDDKRWNQRYVGVLAHRIRDGKLAELVRNPVVDLTTRALYSSVDAVGKDLKFYAGYCGKGEPMQAIPVWFGGPTIRLRNVRVGFRAPG